MKAEDIRFLELFLREAAQFQKVVRLPPPEALWQDQWISIVGLSPLKGGVELELRGGRKLRLLSDGQVETARTRFCDPLLRLIQRGFPRFRVEKKLSRTDRVRHQTASILRVLLRGGRRSVAVLAAYPDSSADLADRVFASLLLWWQELSPIFDNLEALLLIPESWNERMLHCFPFLQMPLVCCKYRLGERGGRNGSMRQIYPVLANQTEIGTPYVLFPRPNKVPALFQHIVRENPDLDLTLRHGAWELSFRGLPVAWQRRSDGSCFFDFLRPADLDDESKPFFDLHVQAVRRRRRFPPPEPGHPFFQARPERWLESLVLRNHQLIDARFVSTVYSQVPSFIDGQRKVLDLLTATRGGRLAAVELKTEKDLGLIFQALEYWERVSDHLGRGDFQRSGYFPGRKLSGRQPLLYLVAPLFEFHSVMPALRKLLKREVRFRCVGVNADWRKELRVLRRFEF